LQSGKAAKTFRAQTTAEHLPKCRERLDGHRHRITPAFSGLTQKWPMTIRACLMPFALQASGRVAPRRRSIRRSNRRWLARSTTRFGRILRTPGPAKRAMAALMIAARSAFQMKSTRENPPAILHVIINAFDQRSRRCLWFHVFHVPHPL
jgi:hypothetical protein